MTAMPGGVPGAQSAGGDGDAGRPRRLRLFILGATGRSGSRLVASAIQQGHSVTAVVRNRARMAPELLAHDALDLVEGDIADAQTIRRSWKGQTPDALFCMLSSEQTPHDTVSTGTHALITALAAQKSGFPDDWVPRPFISIASWGLGPTEPFITSWGARAVVGFAKRTFWAGPHQDFRKQFEMVALGKVESLLRPIFIAPSILTDAPCKTAYLSGDVQAMRRVMRITGTIARWSIADLSIKLAARALSGETVPEWVAIRDMPRLGRDDSIPSELVTQVSSAGSPPKPYPCR